MLKVLIRDAFKIMKYEIKNTGRWFYIREIQMDMGRNGYRRKVKETEEDNSQDFAILLEIREQFVDVIANG